MSRVQASLLGPEPRTKTLEARTERALPKPIVIALVVSVLLEVLILRVYFRVGIFIPKQGAFRSADAALVTLGTFAFNLATVLSLFALARLARTAFDHRRAVLGTALGLFVAGSLLAAMTGSAGPLPRLTFAVAVILIVTPAVRFVAPIAEALAISAAAAAMLLSTYAGLAADLGASSTLGFAPSAAAAQLVGELLVVAASAAFLTASWRTGHVWPRASFLGALPAVALAISWWANGALTGIVVLWAAGLRLYLPIWIYVVALWFVGTAVVARIGEGSGRAAGLVLLLAAGFLLESTYAQAIALVALVLLTDARAFVRADPGAQEAPERRQDQEPSSTASAVTAA